MEISRNVVVLSNGKVDKISTQNIFSNQLHNRKSQDGEEMKEIGAYLTSSILQFSREKRNKREYIVRPYNNSFLSVSIKITNRY